MEITDTTDATVVLIFITEGRVLELQAKNPWFKERKLSELWSSLTSPANTYLQSDHWTSAWVRITDLTSEKESALEDACFLQPWKPEGGEIQAQGTRATSMWSMNVLSQQGLCLALLLTCGLRWSSFETKVQPKSVPLRVCVQVNIYRRGKSRTEHTLNSLLSAPSLHPPLQTSAQPLLSCLYQTPSSSQESSNSLRVSGSWLCSSFRTIILSCSSSFLGVYSEGKQSVVLASSSS